MIRRLGVIVLLACCCALSGCWDQRQIAELVVVLGVGIDVIEPQQAVNNETVLLTVELAHITEKDSEGAPELVSASGKTVLDAMRNLAQGMDHKLHWSHMQMLLIGEAAARTGIDQYLSLFYNNKEMSPHIYFALCEGMARQALSGRAGLSAYAARGLHDTLVNQHYDSNGYIIPLSLQGYMSEHAMPRCGLLVPLAATRKNGTAEAEQDRDTLYFKGMAVLDENSKYVGQLAYEQNSGAALILNQARDFTVALTEPGAQGKVSVELLSWRVRQQWQFGPEPGQIKLTLACAAQGVLRDKQGAGHYNDTAAVEQLEALFSAELKRQIERAWRRCLLMQVDFLGLGRHIYRHHQQEWDELLPNWPLALQDIELEIQITSKVDVAGQSR